MPLTALEIKKAQPAIKPRKLSDGGGLYLQITPKGSKRWRLDYQHSGKRKTISLGLYPAVSLSNARDARDDAKRQLLQGVDPSKARQDEKRNSTADVVNSFELVAREWFGRQCVNWAESHSEKIISRLERDVFPHIGKRPIGEIEAPELLDVLRRIEARTVDTAHRAKTNCGQIFRYGIATGRCSRDVAADLRGALTPLKKDQHFAAATDPAEVGELLRAVYGYQGTIGVQCALKLAPHVFVRPGELRQAEWAHIDLDAAEWRYHVSKTSSDHIVPLSTQAVAILRELEPFTGHKRYCFPSARGGGRPMSDNALLAAMRKMDIPQEQATTHGWRATARTLLDEVLKYRPDIIEHQLCHVVKDANGRAYNRTSHLDERRAMMTDWSNYLDRLRTGADVVQLAARK